MKKKFGNAIVKKVIAVAMATMLVATSPVMNSVAAESNPSLSTAEINDKIEETVDDAKDFVKNGGLDYILDKAEKTAAGEEKIVNDLEDLGLDTINDNIPAIKDAAKQATDEIKEIKNNIDDFNAPVLSDEEAAIVGGLYDGLTDVYSNYSKDGFVNHYDVYKITDDVTDTIETVVGGTITKEVTDATDAADAAENIVAEAEKAVTTLDKYESVTDTLLNNDNELADSVTGNTDNIIEAIEENGNIMVNVENADGEQTQVELITYVGEKKAAAVDAANAAQQSIDNIVNNSNANIAEERAKIDQAIVDAETAKTEAEDAYSAAQAVLLDQIKRYNAYATQYGEELYALEDGSTPAYTAEELEDLKALNMKGDGITTELSKLKNTDLSKQLEEIQATEQLVDSCEFTLEIAKGAVDYVKGVEDSLVSNLTKLRDEAEAALGTANDSQKELLQQIYDHTNFILTEYTKDLTPEGSTTVHPDGDVDTIENRLNYALDSADTLTKEIDTLVQDANDKLYGTDESEGAVKRYNNAVEVYNKLMEEYNSYIAQQKTVDDNFSLLKAKLKAASQAVADANVYLIDAVNAVNSANQVKADFEQVVANMNSNKNDSNSSNNSNGSNSQSSSGSASVVVVTDNKGYATISEAAVPLATTPAMEAVEATISEEPAPLADAVPKTGDASAAAGAVGVSGLVAMLGALFMSSKKRTLK